MTTTTTPEDLTPPDATAGPRVTAATPAVAAAVGGLAFGVLTNLAQGWLPGAWNQLANSGAVWSTAAFAAGALLAHRRTLSRAVTCGLAAEVGLVVGYYGYAEFGRDGMGSLFFPLVWLAMACVAGPLFGVAGHWWRSGRDARRRTVGLAAFAGLFGSEGLMAALDLHHASQAWTCFAVFALVPLLMAGTNRERVRSLALAAPCALLAYAAIDLPLQLVHG
ncbi:DUF6518 family protein [Streptomyces fuscichromogenes]|uniref:Uncharacterized protein n=1 Tax=Streptomyces fuscichromogenes TaxID=1324013 RepID=A0A917XC97_9ACTN|nr:DUF6518 family protein [Streptomyces fuscichromogenes]GGN07984.1 hypothetical protein GCM10011578_032710 [Streptomyces fuscichromogenes]